MNTSGWPRILLAFLCLVALATSAAECAWVLWVEEPVGSNRWSLASRTAFERKRECDEVQRTLTETRIEASKRKLLAQTYRCLPDTVDPRGPKGK
jgi:hypothetical protein